MGDWIADLRYAARGLRRAPAWTTAAVLTLALGIGVTAALASAVYAAAWRPLPYPQAEQLVSLSGVMNHSHEWVGMSPGDIHDWSARSHTLSSLAIYRQESLTLTEPGPARSVEAMLATPELLGTLGIQARLGRGVIAQDLRPGAAAVAMISASVWAKQFESNPDVLDRTLTLDGHRFQIIGVLPTDFSVLVGNDEILAPLTIAPAEAARHGGGMYSAVARIRPGFSVAAAQADLSAAANPDFGVRLTPLHQYLVGPIGNIPWMLVGAGGLILLLACANVAGLLVARAAGRRHETAVRLALGAGRARVARQVFAEGMLLGLGGGLIGGWLAWVLLRSLSWLHPPYWLRTAHAGLEATLAITLAAALLAAGLSSLAPALLAAPRAWTAALQAGGSASNRTGRLRGKLVAGELALALVLAISAGVMIRTVIQLTSQPVGFDPGHVFTTGFAPPVRPTLQATLASEMPFYQGVLERTQALPGVESAALTSMLPFDGMMSLPAQRGTLVASVAANVVSPDYFRTLGVAVLRGRPFSSQDRAGGPGVAIISQRMADQFWPGRSALGERFTTKAKFAPGPWTVIGVAANTRQKDYDKPTQAMVYFPLAQLPYPGLLLVARTGGDPAALVRPLQSVAASVDAAVPLVDPRAMTEILATSIGHQRFLLRLFGMAAGLALLLAAIGVYGAVGTWVEERHREVGVRMALGADRGRVLGLVLGRVLRWAFAGAGLGLVGAWGATQALRSNLFGVKPADPATFAGAAALLLVVALVAAWRPAWRAAGSDPAVALRHE